MIVAVRLLPLPEKTMLLLGTNVWSEENADSDRLPAGVSLSLIVNATSLAVSSLVV